MPNQRAPGQRLINIPASEEFIEDIDKAVAKSGLGDRAKFIRLAIAEKLERMNLPVPAELIGPPTRMGKGGRPTHKAAATAATKLLAVAEDKVDRLRKKSRA